MKKKKHKELLCLRCGNEIPFIRNKDYIICPWCGLRNSKEELGIGKDKDRLGAKYMESGNRL